jgi:uncharacterized repeat protein (TIGR03803 family)
MKKVREPWVEKDPHRRTRGQKNLTVATSRIPWQPLIGLIGAIVVMSVVVSSGEELKHVPPAAPSFTVLHAFTGGDGGEPVAGLLRDGAGNLYGTTRNGGDSGAGVVFRVSPNGTETVLYSFTGGADGGYPYAGLIGDAAGNLYGTTPFGGAENFAGCYHPGNQTCGVVFKLTPSGAETVLYTFTGGADGGNPYATLLPDAAGNLYGTTFGGGASVAGVVFKVSPAAARPCSTPSLLERMEILPTQVPWSGMWRATSTAPPSRAALPALAWCSS